MKPTLVASCILFTLVLSGCSTLNRLPYFNDNSAHATATKAGIAISQTDPAELESISFFTDTPFTANTANACVQEQLIAAAEKTNIKYLGQDILTTHGAIEEENRTLGLVMGRHQIAFHLALLGQHNGTRYGFSQLRLANQDKLQLNSHDAQPILANSRDSKQVYKTLETLFQQLDACVAAEE